MDTQKPDLKEAAQELYEHGPWFTSGLTDEQQDRLWGRLRDAIGLEPGFATSIGVAPNQTSDYACRTRAHAGSSWWSKRWWSPRPRPVSLSWGVCWDWLEWGLGVSLSFGSGNFYGIDVEIGPLALDVGFVREVEQ